MGDLNIKSSYRLTTEHNRDCLLNEIKKIEVSRERPVFVKISDAKEKRSDAINRLAHMWYREVSKQGQEYTPEQVKCIAKKRWALPIMRQHAFFNTRWMKIMETFPTYEEQLEILEFLPVTSLMTNPEMSDYLTHFKQVMGKNYELTEPRLEGIDL